MNKCKGLFGLVFGHKFQPRITHGASDFQHHGVSCDGWVALEMAQLHRAEQYHGDVCARCGAAIQRAKEAG